MINFNYVFVMCLLWIWTNLMARHYNYNNMVFYIKKDRKTIRCTNASMMLGLSMLQMKVLWKLLRRDNPLFFCTRFIYFFRFYNYESGRMTYFNLCISFVFSMNMNKYVYAYVDECGCQKLDMDLWQDVKSIITCFLKKKIFSSLF
jgi:hypothetical protein